jgi:hypothetical protein
MAFWTIRTYYKKSCEQHEHFYHRNIDGAKIIVKDGFRSAEFTIETSDDKFPDIEFTETPGGDGKKDSVDLFNLTGSNIESTELVEMFDGGCWGDIEIEGIEDEDEVERLTDLINEEGAYALEEDGDSDWYLDETECWVWGPLEIEDEEGNVRIIIADEDGNVVTFNEEEDEE